LATFHSAAADNKSPDVASVSPRSIFELPTNVKDGRDPFFPESTRMADDAARAAAASVASSSAEVSSLKVPGISGTPGHLLAIINIQPDAVTVQIAGRIHRIKPDSE
jgi:hypothetical protein